MRYEAENSGAVLDRDTGLRCWFNTFAEAIEQARAMNEREAHKRRARQGT